MREVRAGIAGLRRTSRTLGGFWAELDGAVAQVAEALEACRT